MVRKNTEINPYQGQMFDPDAPILPAELAEWREHMATIDYQADLETVPHVDIKERREALLEALGVLASVSKLGGQRRIVTDPQLADVHKARAEKYPGRIFDSVIVPRSNRKRTRNIAEVETVLDKAFGDVEGSYTAALSDHSQDERVRERFVEHPEKYPDKEELSIAFRAKYAGPSGNRARNETRKLLSGKRAKK